jgi:hypothetical protein
MRKLLWPVIAAISAWLKSGLACGANGALNVELLEGAWSPLAHVVRFPNIGCSRAQMCNFDGIFVNGGTIRNECANVCRDRIVMESLMISSYSMCGADAGQYNKFEGPCSSRLG